MPRLFHGITRLWRTGQTADPLAIAVLAVLLGLSGALLGAGFLEGCYRTFDCSPLTFRLAAGAMLLSLVIGPRLSHDAAVFLARAARRRWAATPRDLDDAGVDPQKAWQRSLLWSVLGVSGLIAVFGAMLLPAGLRLAGWLDRELSAAFVWSGGGLTVRDGGLVLLAGLVPFALLGLHFNCLERVGSYVGRSPLSVLGWALGGWGLGWICAGLMYDLLGGGALAARCGVLPLVASAALAATRLSPSGGRANARSGDAQDDEPELGEHWPAVLRVAVGIGAGMACTGGLLWVHVMRAMHPGSLLVGPASAAGLLIAGAAGLLLAERREIPSVRSVGALGMRCTLAGGTLAGGVAVFSLVHRWSYAPFRDTPGHWLLWLLCACLPLGAAGYAVGQGTIAVLRRSANPAQAGSHQLQLMFIAASLALALIGVPLLEYLGSYAALVAVALALVALGGILVIHEPAGPRQPARTHVVVIFATVLTMTCIMPLSGKGWLRGHRVAAGSSGTVQARLFETWGAACEWDATGQRFRGGEPGDRTSVRSALQPPLAGLLDWEALPSGSRVGVIDWGGVVPTQPRLNQEHFSLVPRSWIRARPHGPSGPPGGTLAAGGDSNLPAAGSGWRCLRAGLDRYDLLLVSLLGAPPDTQRRLAGSLLLERALERLAPDGVLAVVVRPPVRAAESHRFFAAGGNPTFLLRGETDAAGGVCVVYLAGRSVGGRRNAEHWSTGHLLWQDALGGGDSVGKALSAAPGRAPNRY